MTDSIQEKMFDVLSSMSAEDAVRTILDYHGWQLFDDRFAEHLLDEEICTKWELGIADDEEDEEEDDDI